MPSNNSKLVSHQRIFGIRHGQTPLDHENMSDGWLDLSLSEKGQVGLVFALELIKKEPITCIYAPPLKRTEETAEILQSGILSSPNIKIVSEMITWDLGALAGEQKDERRNQVENLLSHPYQVAPYGESYAMFCKRFDTFFKSLLANSLNKGPFLMVLSGSNCRRISDLLYGDRRILDVDEAGIFEISPQKGKWTGKVLEGKRTDKSIKEDSEPS